VSTNPPGETAGESLVLTFDFGLSVVKAAVFRPDGSVVALHEARNDAVAHRGCRSEMSLERLWALICEGVSGVLAAGAPAAAIAGIGLSAAGNGLYLVSPDGEEFIGITSMDGRAEPVAESWRRSPLAERMLEITANHIWAGQPLPLLAHLRQEGALPDDFRILLCKDWLRWRLTGEFVTDRSDASAAGLLDARTGEWAEEILQSAGVGDLMPRLPRLVESTHATGFITGVAARETGLPEGIPVFGGGIDLALGAWADGLCEPDVLHVTAGTWSINQQPCRTVEPAGMQAFLQAILAPCGRHRTLVDSSPTSAINMDLLRAMTGTAEPDFQRWECWLRDTPLGADDPIYFPYPVGAWDLPGRSAEFRQLRAGLRHEQMVAAVYDGIVMGHVRQIRKFERRGALRKLVACGGMTRSPAWCQRLSDYAGLPLEVADNPHSSSWGAALCAFAGLGIEVRPAGRERRAYRPDPARVSATRYQRFCELLQ
jgi:L-xylulokinase